MTTTIQQQQQQQILQAIMKKSKIPRQFIPLICVLIVAKLPTYLLAAFVLGYFMLFKQQQDERPRETKLIEAPPSNLPCALQNSLEYDNEPHYASINHCTLDDQHEQDDISNASSIDFENLMKFPSCPTTLPRLDTHFNFVSDDENHHHLQENSSIDWSAIHQELEYDEQRNFKTNTTAKKEQHPLITSPSQNDMLTFSSSSSTSEEDEEVSSLLLLETASKPSTAIKQTTGSVMTPLPHDNNSTAAILLVDQPDQADQPNQSDQSDQPDCLILPHTAITSIDTIALMDDILLLPPLPRPSLSSPGQLFKSKFQRAPRKRAHCTSNRFSLIRARQGPLHQLA
ncbi:hypothetical protein BD408DRAFT_444683 [Parasitella parasitica]|nr:hypothetical protein BD408DRAFT_444683 [Parasitella parasitica]